MIVEKSLHIARSVDAVFEFVANPLNDPIWCPKVKSVDPSSEGEAVAPGARFTVIHRPVPFLPSRQMDYTLLAWDPPHRIDWREDDGHDAIEVRYTLEPSEEGTLFTQRDIAELAAPRILHPFMRVGIGIDISGQLKRLRRHLEQG